MALLSLDGDGAVATQSVALPVRREVPRDVGAGDLAAELEDPVGHGRDQGVKPVAGHRRHREEGTSVRLGDGPQPLDGLLGPRHVALVGNDDLRAHREVRRIGGELGVDGVVVVDDVTALVPAGHVDHVHDERRALDVAEELVPEPMPLARALDEAGDVSGDEGSAALGACDAEVRDERREGIVGDLRPRRADSRDDGALAHRRHADEGGIGHELHLELDPVLEGGLALLGEGRSPAHGGDEVDVAATSDAAGGDDNALARLGEVGDFVQGGLRLGVELAHDGAERNPEHEVLTVLAVATGSLTVRALLCPEVMLVPVVDERGELRVGLDDDVSAATAVSAVGSALGHECLSAERHAASAAVTTTDVDVGKVCEGIQGSLLEHASGAQVCWVRRRTPHDDDTPWARGHAFHTKRAHLAAGPRFLALSRPIR